jgi:NTP pyrophosphatase (non-canonical NTP hydrolase)
MVPEMLSQREYEFLAISNAFGGEAGELQNIVKKIIRGEHFYSTSDLDEMFVLEAGDALHYLVSLITLFGYDVEFIMDANKKKLEARKQEAREKENIRPKAAPQC